MTRSPYSRNFWLAAALSLIFGIAVAQDAIPLEPGKPVEREIAGEQAHNFQLSLAAGQFIRITVEQKTIDVALVLLGPDGKQLVEHELTGAFSQESLSHLSDSGGEHKLIIRPVNKLAPSGGYRVQLDVRAGATSQDRQRIAAERLLMEAKPVADKGGESTQGAIEKYQSALGLWREVGDRYWEARTLNAIGNAYNRLNRSDQAIGFFEQSLAITRELKDQAGEALSLNSLGSSNFYLDRHDKAIEYFEKMLAINRAMKNRVSEAGALINLGACYNSLAQYSKSVEYLEPALIVMREMKNRNGEAIVLIGLGNNFKSLNESERAIEALEQAIVILRELKNRALEGQTLNILGSVYQNQGRNEAAIDTFERALALSREVKDRRTEAFTLGNLGWAYFNMGRYDKAIELHDKALALSREIKFRLIEGNENKSLADAYSMLGQYEKSFEHYNQALSIYREIKDRNSEASVFANLGILYNYVGQQNKSIEVLERGLSIYREMKSPSGQASILNNLGNAYHAMGRYDRAIEHYNLALAATRATKKRGNEPEVISNLGRSNFSLGRYEKAIEYAEQALAVSRELKDRAVEGRTLNSLGEAYNALKQEDKAIVNFEQALAIHRELENRNDEAGTLYNLAKVERNRGDLTKARSYVEQSLEIAESLRSNIYSRDARSSYLASVQNYHKFYIEVLMRQHKADPTQGIDKLAIEASERARARGMLELLAEAGAGIRQSVDPALLERERSLATQLNAKAASQMQLLSRSHKPEHQKEIKQAISALEDEYEQVQSAIRKSSPRYAAIVQPHPLKLSEIQGLLDPDTLLLEYSLGPEGSFLWAVTKGSLTSYELPGEEVITQSAKQLYSHLTTRGIAKRGETIEQKRRRIASADSQLAASASELSRILLSPVAEQLGDKRLIVVPEGALQYLPFGMLPEPAGSGRSAKDSPLIVKHEMVSLPSASTLAVQRKELGGRQPAPKQLAIIADPVFSANDERMKIKSSGESGDAPTLALATMRTIEHLAGESGTGSGRKLVIPRLPFTRQEASSILAVAPKADNFKATDFKANRATATSGELKEYRYLHFATHGYLDSERPGLSALVLSLLDDQGKPQDGFLRAHEIYNLNLPAELVVLSACQTGLGKEIKGEGLVGLTRGFMYAGAARVVVSLWNVNDRATADLMAKFYQRMLKENQRPAAALRAAQVEMLKQRQWHSPYYWSAFVLQGEWR
jgi:CHAT domain-containing protein/Tfp pilus assembly protein PilF